MSWLSWRNQCVQKGPYSLWEENEKKLNKQQCDTWLQVSHTFAVCMCWLTWYIAISHFSFFSNSLIKVSSNLSVASLVVACSFFISVSSDYNDSSLDTFPILLITEGKLVRFMVVEYQTVNVLTVIPCCISPSSHSVLWFSFRTQHRLFFPPHSSGCQVWSKQTQAEVFPVESIQ